MKILLWNNNNKCAFFFRCLYYFSSNVKLQIHSEDCRKLKDYEIKLPSDDDKCIIFNHCKKERVPFIVYAKCTLEKMDRNPELATYTYQHHNVFSIRYYVLTIHYPYIVFTAIKIALHGSWKNLDSSNLVHSIRSIISIIIILHTHGTFHAR